VRRLKITLAAYNLIIDQKIHVQLTSSTRGHRSAVLVGQLADRRVDIKATESGQIRAEHAFLDR